MDQQTLDNLYDAIRRSTNVMIEAAQHPSPLASTKLRLWAGILHGYLPETLEAAKKQES